MKEAQAKLNAQKDLLKSCNKDINEKLVEQKSLGKEASAAALQVQELEHKVSKCNKDAKEAAKQVRMKTWQQDLCSTSYMNCFKEI